MVTRNTINISVRGRARYTEEMFPAPYIRHPEDRSTLFYHSQPDAPPHVLTPWSAYALSPFLRAHVILANQIINARYRILTNFPGQADTAEMQVTIWAITERSSRIRGSVMKPTSAVNKGWVWTPRTPGLGTRGSRSCLTVNPTTPSHTTNIHTLTHLSTRFNRAFTMDRAPRHPPRLLLFHAWEGARGSDKLGIREAWGEYLAVEY